MLLKTHTQYLLVTLVLLFVIVPLMDTGPKQSPLEGVVFALVFTAVLIGGVYSVSKQRRTLVIGLTLTTPALVATWLGRIFENEAIWVAGQAGFAIALAYLVCVLAAKMITATKADAELIRAAICAYILIGVTWSFFYGLFAHLDPGCISGIPDTRDGRSTALIYYSFTTLTTLGHGDILPLTNLTRTLSVFESLLGQIFLTVTIARLVGMQISARVQSAD